MELTDDQPRLGARAPDVGIVVPAYKEAANIAALLAELHARLPGAAIVVVDDSPDDSTVAAARSLDDPDVEVVHRTGKGGRGSAVLAGMERLLARGVRTVVEMDADFSHRPSELPDLLADARGRELDLLIASRYLPDSRIENWPQTRRIFSKTANHLAGAMLAAGVHDYTNGYRLYSRRAAELVVARCGTVGGGFIALSEILVTLRHAGMRIGERSTVFVNRVRGESSVGTREVASAVVGLWKTFRLDRRLRRSQP